MELTEQLQSPDFDEQMEAEAFVRQAIEQMALVVNEALYLYGLDHRLDDDLLWSITRKFDRIRVNLFREMHGRALLDVQTYAPNSRLKIHPAVREFVVRLRLKCGEF